MEINRNQYYMIGLVLLFLGIQFYLVDTVELTPEFTQFLAKRTGHPLASVNSVAQSLTENEKPPLKKTLRPPEFLGWALGSLGLVLALHSLAMPKPG